MKRTTKRAIVLAGYALAIVAAVIAGCSYKAGVPTPSGVTSAGNIAFERWLRVFGAFGVASLVPTGLALYFGRGSERAARVISRVGMAVALTAPLCGVYMALAIRFGPHHPEMLVVTSLALIRLVGSPLLAVVWAAAGFLAVGKTARRTLWIAAGIESAVAVLGAFVWKVLMF